MIGHSTSFTWNGAIVGSLKTINGIELSVDSVDITTHQSADYYKEFTPGLIEAGDVSVEGYFDNADTTGQQGMLTDANAREIRTGVITFPSSVATWTFSGFITKIKIGDATTEGIPFTASVKITGKPTFAIATSTGISALELSESAVLAPTFAIGTFDYVATVLTGVTSITVTPTASAGTITVNGNTVVSGEASSAIALGAAGSITTITVKVTETNKAPKTYTIRVVRAAS